MLGDHNFGPTLACIDMWILKLHDDLVERIDRPERITLADGLTIGRGRAAPTSSWTARSFLDSSAGCMRVSQ